MTEQVYRVQKKHHSVDEKHGNGCVGSDKDTKSRQREPSVSSALAFFTGTSSSHKKSIQDVRFTDNISDYDLVGDIGGVDDISYLYLAKYKATGEMVALQYTDLTISPDFEFIDELIRNVRNAKLCRHPNILPYFYTFVENERLWSVTYPVSAGSCREILKNHFATGFNEQTVAVILKEVLKGVLYMHQNYMIHNDIRANNILIDAQGEVRITGLRQMAHLALNGGYIKSVFSLVGDNIEWAAPEVMAQNGNYDQQADVYSIGITALELAYNKTPFDGWPPLKVLLCKLEYDCPAIPQDASQPHRTFSSNFYRFVQACLVRDPSARPTVSDLMEFPFVKQAKGGSVYLETQVVRKVVGEGGSVCVGSGEGRNIGHAGIAKSNDISLSSESIE